MYPIKSADIFCEVIDNFGDAGVCWRLARSLVWSGLSVRLWINDLQRLQRLRPRLNVSLREQVLDGFRVMRWDEAFAAANTSSNEAIDAAPYVPADLVIEAFACRMPYPMLEALASANPRPAWVNLEYLSAESWAKANHALPSPHPRLPLTQHFYFPGFEAGTGGLIREEGLDEARAAFDAQARLEFLSRLGVNAEGCLLVSLFCYSQAPVRALLAAMQSGPRVCCLIPEGVAVEAVQQLTGGRAEPGTQITLGQLTLKVIPFLDPDDYDRLLWSCDLNFVRGEDSLVRAHWSRQPFVWQLYPQEDRAHLVKMDAFLDVFLRGFDGEAKRCVTAATSFWRVWNQDESAAALDWPALCEALPHMLPQVRCWASAVSNAGELTQRIVEFAGKIR